MICVGTLPCCKSFCRADDVNLRFSHVVGFYSGSGATPLYQIRGIYILLVTMMLTIQPTGGGSGNSLCLLSLHRERRGFDR